jgi:hypothetical protein
MIYFQRFCDLRVLSYERRRSLGRPQWHMEDFLKGDVKDLSANGGHDPLRLPVVAEGMFKGFFRQGLIETVAQAFPVEGGAQRGLQIVLTMIAQARAQVAISGEAHLVA